MRERVTALVNDLGDQVGADRRSQQMGGSARTPLVVRDRVLGHSSSHRQNRHDERRSGSRKYVGIDLHRRRSVIVHKNSDGELLSKVHIDNDPHSPGCRGGRRRTQPRGRARSAVRLVLGR